MAQVFAVARQTLGIDGSYPSTMLRMVPLPRTRERSAD